MLEKGIGKVTDCLAKAALVFLVAMLAINLIDVSGAKFFKFPLPGATEFTSLFQVAAISLAIAYTLRQGRHIRIDFVVARIKQRVAFVLNVFVLVAELFLFATLAYGTFLYAVSLKRAGEKGATSGLPFYPFAWILFLSALVVALTIFAKQLVPMWRAFRYKSPKES
ncbi:MAG: TRAP transporter small permease [Candidatus Bathyarchaeia archaeon]